MAERVAVVLGLALLVATAGVAVAQTDFSAAFDEQNSDLRVEEGAAGDYTVTVTNASEGDTLALEIFVDGEFYDDLTHELAAGEDEADVEFEVNLSELGYTAGDSADLRVTAEGLGGGGTASDSVTVHVLEPGFGPGSSPGILPIALMIGLCLGAGLASKSLAVGAGGAYALLLYLTFKIQTGLLTSVTAVLTVVLAIGVGTFGARLLQGEGGA